MTPGLVLWTCYAAVTLVSSYDPTKPSTLGTTLGVAGVGPAATATGIFSSRSWAGFRRVRLGD